jgi:hypothetical protein
MQKQQLELSGSSGLSGLSLTACLLPVWGVAHFNMSVGGMVRKHAVSVATSAEGLLSHNQAFLQRRVDRVVLVRFGQSGCKAGPNSARRPAEAIW